jgi:methionine-rich copper-binding protein CopC
MPEPALPLALSTRRGLLAGLAVLGLAPRPAAAHALVLSATPDAGARLVAMPAQVALRFNSRIDHARSRLTLFGADNVAHPLALLAERQPALVEAALPAGLGGGEWRLRWQVLAVDGHITRGDIFFSVTGG